MFCFLGDFLGLWPFLRFFNLQITPKLGNFLILFQAFGLSSGPFGDHINFSRLLKPQIQVCSLVFDGVLR